MMDSTKKAEDYYTRVNNAMIWLAHVTTGK